MGGPGSGRKKGSNNKRKKGQGITAKTQKNMTDAMDKIYQKVKSKRGY
jgi:hypothetical protein